MRYMLIHAADQDLAAAWDDEAQAAFASWLEESINTRVNLQGSRLRPVADATTVEDQGRRAHHHRRPVCGDQGTGGGLRPARVRRSLDEAVRWAGRHPSSWAGAIEVRALPECSPAVPLPKPAEGKIRYLLFVCTDPAVDPREFDRIEPARSLGR